MTNAGRVLDALIPGLLVSLLTANHHSSHSLSCSDMSDYYDECDQEFDSAFLKEIDAIEEAASNVSAPAPDSKVPNPSSTTSSSKPTFKSTHSYHTKAPIPSSSTVFFFKPASNSGPPKPDTSQQPAKPPSKPAPAKQDTSFDEYDISLDIDASELAKLDEFISDSYAGKAQPIAGPSRPRQTTLDGSVYHPPSAPPPQQQRSSSTTSKTLERTKSAGSRGNGPLFGFSERRTKVWDRTQFAETGFRSKPAERLKEKGKGKENVNGDFDKEEDGEIEFEQFPTPQVTSELCDLLCRVMLIDCSDQLGAYLSTFLYIIQLSFNCVLFLSPVSFQQYSYHYWGAHAPAPSASQNALEARVLGMQELDLPTQSTAPGLSI